VTRNFRKTWAEINLDAYRHNIKEIKTDIGPHTKLCSVLKANAYGHGAVELGKVAQEENVDYLAVALLEEGILLRENDITLPILVFGTLLSEEEIAAAADYHLTISLYTKEQATQVLKASQKTEKNIQIHLNIETGMNRDGAQTKEETLSLVQTLDQPQIEIEGIYSHFADAEEDYEFTRRQYKHFIETLSFLRSHGYNFDIAHIANSSASSQYPATRLDMVRIGIELLGVPSSEKVRNNYELKPLMSLKSTIVHLKKIQAGETVSYGRTFLAKDEKKIATVAIGYADGLPRSLSNQTLFTVNGSLVQTAGKIAMDQFMIDVSEINDVKIGDEVVIFGEPAKGEPDALEIGEAAGTIECEIWTHLSPRVPRVYKNK
jgi:alanine racemase